MTGDQVNAVGADGRATSKPVGPPDPLAAELLATEHDLLTASSLTEHQTATARRDRVLAQMNPSPVQLDPPGGGAPLIHASQDPKTGGLLAEVTRERDEARDLVLKLLEHGPGALRNEALPDWARVKRR